MSIMERLDGDPYDLEEMMITNQEIPEVENNSTVLRVASWNVAAINNNPFEYWVDNPNLDYHSLMQGIQTIIQDPGNDIPLNRIFSDEMFDQLCIEMSKQSIEGLDKVSQFWENDFRNRRAIGGFMKDKQLGLKRLVSMPDRITNTINLASGETCMRPTVINAYDGGSLQSIELWWQQWKEFMFYTEVQISTGKNTKSSSPPLLVCKLLSPILRSKYPAISIEEQAASVALQILCLAILDAIFVYLVNIVSPGGKWEAVRRELCRELIRNKTETIRSILFKQYTDMDVIFIQEAAAIFVQKIHEHSGLHAKYALLRPWNLDGKRDQNSMILVRRDRFRDAGSTDMTSTILDGIDGSWVAPGDLVAYSISDNTGRRWLLVSFHGDSNGLSTQPFMEALDTIVQTRFKDHILVVGLDANTHSVPPDMYHHSVESFCAFISDHDMVSLWGEVPDPSLHTTCSARTFLQTQLNKAMSFEKRLSQKNLKDWIVVYRHQSLLVSEAIRDNTGHGKFIEGVVLPSLQFPSDHAIVSASISFHFVSSSTMTVRQSIKDITEEISCGASDVDASRRTSGDDKSLASLSTSESRTRISAARLMLRREKTLYDYWGLRDKPITETIFASVQDSCGANGSDTFKLVHQMSLEEEVSKICEDHYVKLVTKPRGEDFDSRRLIFSKVEDNSLWILFSSRPVSMTMCKLWGQLLFVSLALQYLLEFVLNILAICDVVGLDGNHYRFTPLMHRNGLPVATTNSSIIHSLGLLMEGCIVSNPSNMSISGNSILLAFDRPVKFNGWYFTTAAYPLSAGLDPVEFRFERSIDGFTWSEIKPPPWIRKADYYTVPIDRMSTKIVDLHPPWPWILFWCVGMLLMCLGNLLSSGLGATGRGRQAGIVLTAVVSIFALFALVNGVHRNVVGPESLALDSILYWAMAIELLFLAFIFFTEVYTVQLAAPVFSLFGISTYFVKLCHFPNPISQVSQYLPLVWTVMPSFAALIQNVVRLLVQRWVFKNLVKHERESYDAAWAKILDGDLAVGALDSLCRFSEKIEACAPQDSVIQRHGSFKSSVYDYDYSARDESRHQTGVLGLDGLFKQAAALDPFLRHKVKQLAEKSSGCLLVQVEDGSVCEVMRCSDIAASQKYGRVIWAKLKPVERALEKLLRVYSCEVSRLLDCCRQRILFDDPASMTLCLEAMINDEEIEILRIKNRMNPHFNSYFSGGFRNIVINLRIRSELTKKLGIDNHICELQLIPTHIDRLKSEEYHKRYLILRNCRHAPSFVGDLHKNIASFSKSSIISSLGKIPKWLRTKQYDQCSRNSFGDNTLNSCQCSQVVTNPPQATEPSNVPKLDANKNDLPADRESDQEKHELRRGLLNHSMLLKSVDQISGDSFVCNRRNAFLEKQFFCFMTSRSNLSSPGYRGDKVLEDAIAQTPLDAIWNTSHPFAAALCKPWMSVLALVVFASLVFNLILGIDVMRKNALQPANTLRFTALDGSLSSGISSIGFLTDSCSHQSLTLAHFQMWNASKNSITISYDSIFAMNGWWVSVPLDAVDQFPKRFFVEVSTHSVGHDATNDGWTKVGSSSFFWTGSGSVLFFEGRFDLSQKSHAVKTHVREREIVIEFDMRLPWIWSYTKCFSNIVLMLLLVSVLVCVYLKRQLQARWFCALFWLIVHVGELVAFIGYVQTNQIPLAMLTAIFSVSDLLYASMFAFYEKYFGQVSGACGILFIGANIAHYLYLQSPEQIFGSWAGLENRGVFEGIGLLVICSFRYFAVYYCHRRAQNSIAVSRAAYDHCWETLYQSDNAEKQIERLSKCTDSITEGLSADVRQRGNMGIEHICAGETHGCNQNSSSSVEQTTSESRLSINGTAGKANKVHPEENNCCCEQMRTNSYLEGAFVLDLDQLFAQAMGVDVPLQLKVQQWASSSHGSFPIVSTDGEVTFERWEKIVGSDKMLANVKWGRVKSRTRAIEKLYRCYDCDVSRLLDCCRQSIVFENLDDLLACMNTIACDPQCRIIRAKNRLTPDHDHSMTAGYRDVVLNLQVITDETRRLKVETHICEVQLLTVDFAKVKSQARHKDYLDWRNLQTERCQKIFPPLQPVSLT